MRATSKGEREKERGKEKSEGPACVDGGGRRNERKKDELTNNERASN